MIELCQFSRLCYLSIVLVLVFLSTGCSSLLEQDNVDELNMTAPVDVSVSMSEIGNDATILLIFEVSGSGHVTTGTGEVDSGYFKAIDDNNVLIDLPGKKRLCHNSHGKV